MTIKLTDIKLKQLHCAWKSLLSLQRSQDLMILIQYSLWQDDCKNELKYLGSIFPIYYPRIIYQKTRWSAKHHIPFFKASLTEELISFKDIPTWGPKLEVPMAHKSPEKKLQPYIYVITEAELVAAIIAGRILVPEE